MKRKLLLVILVVVAVAVFRSFGKTKDDVADVYTSWEKKYGKEL